jgi:hypothetical protein
MENHQHLYRLSQPLLDVHHSSMTAEEAARSLGSALLGPWSTGLDVLVMMLDDVTRAGLGKHQLGRASEMSTERMLAELVSRLYSRWLIEGLCPDTYGLFKVATDFVEARSTMIDAYRAHRKVPTLRALNISAVQCLDASDSLYQRALYFSRAADNIKGMCCGRLTALFLPRELGGTPGSLQPSGPQPTDRMLADYSDRELGIRLMHTLRNNRLASYDPTYPVNGVRSIYLLIPLLISYLTHPSAKLERAMPCQLADLNASLAELSLQMEAVNKRYERLRAASL